MTKTKSLKKTKEFLNTKKGKLPLSLSSIGVAIVLILAITLPIVLRIREWPFVIPELSVPIEDDYALTKYTYNELDDVKTTVRNDAMDVTERGIERATPNMLKNDFSLVYDADANKLYPVYDKYMGGADEKVATISFGSDNYPASYYGNTMTAERAYAHADQSIKDAHISQEDYFAYYKYMLMTQGQHLAHETAWRVAATASESDEINADFAAWLAKHPMADAQYGAVKGENNAVEKVIILDPIYRSLHTTGLYLPAGEPVTIKVEGLAEGERIGINLGSHDSMAWRGSVPNADATIREITGGKTYTQVNYQNATSDYFFKQADIVTAGGKFFEKNSWASSSFLQSQWKRQNARAPWIQCSMTFTENKTYTIGYAFGGLIQINMGNCYSNVKVTIRGAVETPHYILGVTTPEYFDQYLKDAPGVIAALDTENGILTGPTGELDNTKCANMRTVKKEEIDKLAMLWHSFLSVNESFTGGSYNRFNKVNFDWHVPAGAAVALGGYTFAQPTGWFTDAMNYQRLLKSGTWGTLHEIGHNHASAYGTPWGFGSGKEGEVRNNALTQLSYIQFLDTGTSVRNKSAGVEHGEYSTPYNALLQAINVPNVDDFNNGAYDYFRCLGMYANIMHSFGADKFYELLYTYKLKSSYSSYSDATLAKRADFAYRCAITYGMNFIDYFNKLYHANITDAMFDEDQLILMKSLPNYQPVASFYAGGIDGVKTAGDYIVTFGEDLTFDLMGTTISSLDTKEEKGFTVISVDQPRHGSIRKQGTKWVYSFNKSYAGATDQFTFTVKLKDGVIHRLTIYLRINYNNNARLTTYQLFDSLSGGINDKTWPTVMEKLVSLPYTTQNNANSYISNYQTPGGKWEVRSLEFYWKAPKTGEVTFHLKRDDGVKFYFGKSFADLEEQSCYSHDSGVWTDEGENEKKYSVVQDKYYAIKLLNVNTGGSGSASIGYRYPEEAITSIPTSQMYHPQFPLGQKVETYVLQPNYMVSKKDNIKLSNAGTDKTMWEVLKAPEIIEGGVAINEEGEAVKDKRGHYKVTTLDVIQVDENGNYLGEDGKPLPKDEDGNPIGTPAREEHDVVTDYWDYLIDGETGTNLHTAYQGSGYTPLSEANPHEFIIDTKKVQPINFFKVTTRNHANSYIESFELYFASTKTAEGFDWELITTGDRTNYVGNSITLKFDAHKARYIKLVVKKASGKTFTVLSEIDAGIDSPTQKLVSLSSSKLFTTSGWKSTTQIESEPNGYLMAQSANQAAVVKFKGTSVALYARTDVDCGKIRVIVDGDASEIDLHSESRHSRQLVYYVDNLEDKEHTMEIITMGSQKVVLNAVGLPYSGSLLNAPNIYLEKALTISLVVFVLLFAAITAFTLCLLFIPKFRKFMGNNKAINLLDKKLEESKAKRKEKKAAKAKSQPKADKAAKTDAKAKTDTKTKADNKAKATAKTDTNKTVKTEKPKVEPKAQAKPQPKTEVKVQAKPQPKTEVKSKQSNVQSKTTVKVADKKTTATRPVEKKPQAATSKKPDASKKTAVKKK